jgi:hypothetical protein
VGPKTLGVGPKTLGVGPKTLGVGPKTNQHYSSKHSRIRLIAVCLYLNNDTFRHIFLGWVQKQSHIFKLTEKKY